MAYFFKDFVVLKFNFLFKKNLQCFSLFSNFIFKSHLMLSIIASVVDALELGLLVRLHVQLLPAAPLFVCQPLERTKRAKFCSLSQANWIDCSPPDTWSETWQSV